MNTVLERVKKLLSLANSDNEHEARLAAQKAAELLTKHNLSISALNVEQEYESIEIGATFTRVDPVAKFVSHVVKTHFYVRSFIDVRRVAPGKNVRQRIFVGTKENVEIAAYVYEYLMREYKHLWKAYRDRERCGTRAMQSYYSGLTRGLCEQLAAAQSKVAAEAGLMIVPDHGLQRYMAATYPKLYVSNSRLRSRDDASYESGMSDGSKIAIRKGVASTATHSNARIGDK